ncbi:hypothetical protein DK26_07135 [Bosea sp. WAO]|nr:hypothetical protein DK26_07135 [Bosea sp. WAO]
MAGPGAEAKALRPISEVVPGDRRETRDPCLNFPEKWPGMDPGSTRLKPLVRDDGAGRRRNNAGEEQAVET